MVKKDNKEFIKLIKITKGLEHLFESKNHDYASDEDPFSNFVEGAKAANTTPYLYCMGRIGEKLGRLEELNKNLKTPKHESIEDSLIDISALSLIAIILQRRKV